MKKTAKEYEAIVIDLLTQYPSTREHDLKLYWRVASKLGCPLETLSAKELMLMWDQKRMPLIETIKRIRYRIQQHNVHLRGPNYQERKTKLVRYVRKALAYPVSA